MNAVAVARYEIMVDLLEEMLAPLVEIHQYFLVIILIVFFVEVNVVGFNVAVAV